MRALRAASDGRCRQASVSCSHGPAGDRPELGSRVTAEGATFPDIMAVLRGALNDSTKGRPVPRAGGEGLLRAPIRPTTAKQEVKHGAAARLERSKRRADLRRCAAPAAQLRRIAVPS